MEGMDNPADFGKKQDVEIGVLLLVAAPVGEFRGFCVHDRGVNGWLAIRSRPFWVMIKG